MSVITRQNPLGGKVITDTSVDATVATNVTGAATVLTYIEVDNTANSAASCTTAGGTAGTGSPSSAVIVRMIAS